MKQENFNKIAAAIACELIGCNGDCDNCDKNDVKDKHQNIINEINRMAAHGLKMAKSFNECSLSQQRRLIFDKEKHFDVLERVIAIHQSIKLAKDVNVHALNNLIQTFHIYHKLIKNWNDNINHIVEEDLKVLNNIYYERINNSQQNADTTVDLSDISKEDLKKELARRAKK